MIKRALGVMFAAALLFSLYFSLRGLPPIVTVTMCAWILWALLAPSTGKAK